jgi:hypothetical protein
MIGKTHWAIAEGYIPPDNPEKPRPAISHEACCVLNAGEEDADIEIRVFFEDREPAGPFRFTVPARRTHHLRFNDFRDPEPIPPGTDFASVLTSSVPVVVQHTRLDTRDGTRGLMSTIAWAD